MKYLLLILFTALIGCASQSSYINRLPMPQGEDVLISLMASPRDYDKYVKSSKYGAGDLELKVYYHFHESLIQNAYEIQKILNRYLYVSNSFPLCYDPGHFISYNSSAGSVTVEICFECGRAKVEINGWQKWFRIKSGAEPELAELLAKNEMFHPKYGSQ